MSREEMDRLVDAIAARVSERLTEDKHFCQFSADDVTAIKDMAHFWGNNGDSLKNVVRAWSASTNIWLNAFWGAIIFAIGALAWLIFLHDAWPIRAGK